MTEINLAYLESSLSVDALAPPNEMEWLDISYKNPVAFWGNFIEAKNALTQWPGKSVLLEKYDFYHDIVVCNQQKAAPAFICHDIASGWEETSYLKLGQLATQKSVSWMDCGIASGQRICIILPMGKEFAVSLLSALRMGLIISFLPPSGTRFLEKRLEALNPEYIITEEIYAHLIPDWKDKIIHEDSEPVKPPADEANSHVYSAKDPVFICFNPSSTTPHIPETVSGNAAYLFPVRDGQLAMGIRPGYIFTAPGYHFLETQPAMLLSVLLNGATYLHLEPKSIAEDPDLLKTYPVNSIGLTDDMRDRLLKQTGKIGETWNFWFKTPTGPLEYNKWQQFIETFELNHILSGNIQWKASSGGCILFSVKRKGRTEMNILPSAGVSWLLTDLSGGGEEVFKDFGLLTTCNLDSDDGKTVHPIMISGKKNEWLYAGSGISGRRGRYYPVEEILENVKNINHCYHCSIIDIPALGSDDSPSFALIVFIGGQDDIDKAVLSDEISSTIKQNMDPEFLPDRIQFFSIYPRKTEDGAIDHAWCKEQYLAGSLFRKNKDDIYQHITRLRKYILMEKAS